MAIIIDILFGNTMPRKSIELDEKDRKIITLIHDDQDISQEEIAKKVKLSQPSVAIRIKRLKERGIINQIIGVNLNKVGIYVAMVMVRTTNTTKILNMFRKF